MDLFPGGRNLQACLCISSGGLEEKQTFHGFPQCVWGAEWGAWSNVPHTLSPCSQLPCRIQRDNTINQ